MPKEIERIKNLILKKEEYYEDLRESLKNKSLTELNEIYIKEQNVIERGFRKKNFLSKYI